MSTNRRKFTFPLSTLTSAATRLIAALNDADYATRMKRRLGENCASVLNNKLSSVTVLGGTQAGQTGSLSDLTRGQREQFQEMERLAAGARRTARLAFPGDTTRLREEFQVGIDEPKTLAAEIERAGKTHAACGRHAAALTGEGWLVDDTNALGAAIEALTAADVSQEEALDDRMGMTSEKVSAGNALYKECLRVQNAARLEFPDKKDAVGNPLNVVPRERFLLNEFPPRDRSQPDGGTQGGTPPPAPPAPTP